MALASYLRASVTEKNRSLEKKTKSFSRLVAYRLLHRPDMSDEEEEWTLDDAQHDLVEDESEQKKKRPPPGMKTTEFTETFIQEHPVPHFDSPPRIALPVILPQRRPKIAREDSFVPMLQYSRKLESTKEPFLTFLKTLTIPPRLGLVRRSGVAELVL